MSTIEQQLHAARLRIHTNIELETFKLYYELHKNLSDLRWDTNFHIYYLHENS